MTIELIGSILFFILTVFALIFSLIKSSNIDIESFPNRGRFFIGLILWTVSSILAVFMSFPGYLAWFVPIVYPVMKIAFSVTFLVGFFMVLTTVNAFPLYMDAVRQEMNGRSDRVTLLENIRRIASQPYPVTELFSLILKELGSSLVLKKGAVFLINPSNHEMYLVAQIGLTKEEMSRLERFPIGRDIISRAAAEQLPFISGDLAASDSSTRKLILGGRDITMSAAAMPLSARDRSLGAMLVLSDKPYRFEKQERMILISAAEAVAAEVESNRLIRENQELVAQLDNVRNRLEWVYSDIRFLATEKDISKYLTGACKAITNRYGIASCRIVRLVRGELNEISHYEAVPDLTAQSESYRIAVIDAIRRHRMVVLNQEAKGETGAVFVSRSTLLCPIAVWKLSDYALLVEAPGNGLPLTESFLREIDVWVHTIAISLNISGLKEAESLSRSGIKSLLSILKISHRDSKTQIYGRFLEEAMRILPPSSSVIIFVPDQQQGYRVFDGANVPIETITNISFLPGEGPIGKTAASGDVLEYCSISEVENAWRDLEPANQDFFSKLFGEKGLPSYQLNIPIIILEDTAAIIAVFDHVANAGPERREKGLLLLAAQLLSIKLSMAQMDEQGVGDGIGGQWKNAGAILNRLNNDLATIIGRAQLLDRQSDISGRTKYTSGEILKASESAALLIQKLQDGLVAPTEEADRPTNLVLPVVESILVKRRVTGNLYMFEDNKPVVLQSSIEDTLTAPISGDAIRAILDSALKKFVTFVEDNQEVCLKSELKNGKFYLSIIRGNKDDFDSFQASVKDFGDPDVLPNDFAKDEMVRAIREQRGQVSFDRFGRRPTYLSFCFLEQQPNVPPLTEAKKVDSVSNIRILAIDDQQMILDLLTGICKSLGIQLTAVQDPEEGISLFREDRFDMVMVDLVMEGLSGWDVARAVKRQSPQTPVILMTGWGVALSKEETRQAGIDFTLTKPFKIEQLTGVIAKARQKRVAS